MTEATGCFYADSLSFGLPLCESCGVDLLARNAEGYRKVLNVSVPCCYCADPQRIQVADAIRSFVRDDLAPDLGASFAADLLGYALDQVDWFEIADAWLSED